MIHALSKPNGPPPKWKGPNHLAPSHPPKKKKTRILAHVRVPHKNRSSRPSLDDHVDGYGCEKKNSRILHELVLANFALRIQMSSSRTVSPSLIASVAALVQSRFVYFERV